MLYSEKDIRELCLDIDKILINGDRFNDKVADLKDLQNRLGRKAKFKEIDFQSKCEEDNSLGDLLLKNADENGNSRVKDFLLKNGFQLPQQEQVAAAMRGEEEQSIPEVEENKVENSSANSSNSRNTQFATLCSDKDFVLKNGFKHGNKENFHASLRDVAIGVVIIGLFIAAAVMVPSLAGALVCGVLAILVAIGTGLHVKNSTLPSYREMKENGVEHVNPSIQML